MSEPPTNQEDFFVWIKNLDSHMENREQFLRGLRNAFGKVLLSQISQESEIVFRATVTINTTREILEAASNELNTKARPILMTFKEFLRRS